MQQSVAPGDDARVVVLPHGLAHRITSDRSAPALQRAPDAVTDDDARDAIATLRLSHDRVVARKE